MAIGIPELLGANVTDAGNLFTFSENKNAVLVVNKGTGQVAGSIGVVPATATPADGRFTLGAGESFFVENGSVLSIGIRAAVGLNADIDVIGIAETEPGPQQALPSRSYTSLEIAFAIYGANAYTDIACPNIDNFVIPPGGGIQNSALHALSAPINGNDYWGISVRGTVLGDIQILTGGGLGAAVTALLNLHDAAGVLLGGFALPGVQVIDTGGPIIGAGNVGGTIGGLAPGLVATQCSTRINATANANGAIYNCGGWNFRCLRR